jgi:hypothetical protein
MIAIGMKIEAERLARSGLEAGGQPERQLGRRVPANEQMRAVWRRDAGELVAPALGPERKVTDRLRPGHRADDRERRGVERGRPGDRRALKRADVRRRGES